MNQRHDGHEWHAQQVRAAPFKAGDRVQLHPATDLWMRGVRYGTVAHVSRIGTVYVNLDAFEGRCTPHRFQPRDLEVIA